MKRTSIVLMVLLAALLMGVTACSSDPDGDPYIPTVYVAGDYEGNPCYWVNTARKDLSDTAGTAYVITVADGNVYTAGKDGGGVEACYWINQEEREDIVDSGFDPKAIAVVNGTVYIAGTYYDGVTKYTYWIDGEWQEDILTPTGCSYINDITVAANGDIYYCGAFDSGSYDIACYWKHEEGVGVPAYPPVDSESSVEYIAVVNGTVYTVGWYKDGADWPVCQWVDEEDPTDLSGGVNGCSYAITASGGKVYVVGADSGGELCYWVNGGSPKPLKLPADATNPMVTGIAASSGVVAVSGSYSEDGTGHQIACCWVNGECVPLGKGGADSSALGVYVK